MQEDDYQSKFLSVKFSKGFVKKSTSILVSDQETKKLSHKNVVLNV